MQSRGAFVVALGADLRVLAHYEHWCHARDLPRLWRRMDATRSEPDMGACADAMARPASAAERAAIADLLAAMGLRFQPRPESDPWAVDALVTLFRVAAYNDVAARIGVPPKDVAVELHGLAGLPPGRRARHFGADVERDAVWTYRHFVKHPADTISALAEEWATREKRTTDARSVVQNGIDRAISLLDLAMSRSGELIAL